jgi:hypothetical protein
VWTKGEIKNDKSENFWNKNWCRRSKK